MTLLLAMNVTAGPLKTGKALIAGQILVILRLFLTNTISILYISKWL